MNSLRVRFDWNNVRNMRPPVVPKLLSPTDTSHFQTFGDESEQREGEPCEEPAFEGFTFKRLDNQRASARSLFEDNPAVPDPTSVT